MFEYAFCDETFYRLYDVAKKSFYCTSKGKSWFQSLSHLKSSLRQRHTHIDNENFIVVVYHASTVTTQPLELS